VLREISKLVFIASTNPSERSATFALSANQTLGRWAGTIVPLRIESELDSAIDVIYDAVYSINAESNWQASPLAESNPPLTQKQDNFHFSHQLQKPLMTKKIAIYSVTNLIC